MSKLTDKISSPEESIFAYIDMLGASERIKNDNFNRYFSDLRALLMSIKNSEANRQEFKINTFSDNICVSKKLTRKPHNDLLKLLKKIRSFQRSAINHHNWYARGAIGIGEIYSDEYIVWGKGLLKGYNSENKHANYARFIIDDDCMDIYRNIKKFQDKPLHEQLIIKDFDGKNILNYLCVEDKVDYLFFDIHKRFLSLQINENHKNSQALSKILMSIEYHNRICELANLNMKKVTKGLKLCLQFKF